MPDSRAITVLQQQSQLENDRSTWDSHWEQVAERVLPRQDDFNGKNITEGSKRSEKIFDSTAVLALDRAASAIDSLVVPSTQQYHGMEADDEELRDDREVKLYLEQLNRALFRMRYRPIANFASQAHECFISLMAFGTLGMFIDDIMGIGTRYKSIALSEMFIAESHAGLIDMVHRKFPLSARAAIQKWGNKVPEKIRKEAERNPFTKFTFLHCVRPNPDMKPGRKDYRGMPFQSYFVSYDEQAIIEEGGYRAMPYAVSRHVTAPRETYGRSPAMMVLADIKMVNEMEKTLLRAAHKIVDPPLLIYGDGILSAFSVRPNAMNYGGVDERGNQLVVPMKTGSNLPIALDMTEQKRKVINDAFYVTLFQILVQNPQMTATEALIRAQEKGQLLAPTVGRQESEFIGGIVQRELSILHASNALGPMPQKLIERGGVIKIKHTSPLSRLRRAEDGVAIMRTIEALLPLAQQKPQMLDVFDEDAVAQELADINGVPVSVLRTKEMIMQIREARAQAEQTQVDLQSAEVAAGAAKNMAQAANEAGFVEPATA